MESLGAEKLLIRHTSKAQGTGSKIEEKDKQFLIEKIMHRIKNENPHTISTEKSQELCAK